MKCPVCQSEKNKKIYNQTLFTCDSCSHIWADLTLNEEELRKIYAENYFKGEEYADYLSDKIILQSNFLKRLKSLKQLKPTIELKNVLELGCAYGFFGELMVNIYKPDSYIGFDISQDSIEYANKNFGNYFRADNYLTFDLSKQNFSDVFMWDVIEHLTNPELFIEKISRETSSKGRLYITTGDISAWLPKRQKEKWRMIHPPTHIHYFTKKSITELLNKYGFDVERITYPPVSRSLKVIFFSLFILNKKPNSFIKKIYDLIPEKASISLNTFDIMFVVAKKRNSY